MIVITPVDPSKCYTLDDSRALSNWRLTNITAVNRHFNRAIPIYIEPFSDTYLDLLKIIIISTLNIMKYYEITFRMLH